MRRIFSLAILMFVAFVLTGFAFSQELRFADNDAAIKSNTEVVAEINRVAAKWKLNTCPAPPDNCATILTPVQVVTTNWAPEPYAKFFVVGLVRIPNWFGGRTIPAADFLASPTNDVDKKMERYARELRPPQQE